MQHSLCTIIIILLLLSFLQQVVHSMNMEARLYLVRHGETIANKQEILQGHCDFPLTDDGEQQALSMGSLLQDKIWHKVYCSDLQRAQTSAKLVLSRSNTWPAHNSLILRSSIREMTFGVKEGLPRSTTVEEAISIKAKSLGIPEDEVIDTAEQAHELKDRQLEFLKELYADCQSDPSFSNGSSLLCVSHGGFIRHFIQNFCGKTEMKKIGNCSASVICIQWNGEDDFVCTPVENALNIPCNAPLVP